MNSVAYNSMVMGTIECIVHCVNFFGYFREYISIFKPLIELSKNIY